MANFPPAKDESWAEPLSEAVAPVKIREGGYLGSGEVLRALRRSGSAALENRNAP